MAKKKQERAPLKIEPALVDTVRVVDAYGNTAYFARARSNKVTTVTFGDPDGQVRLAFSDAALEALITALKRLHGKRRSR